MDIVALVMAGGSGRRMSSSGPPTPKPLVRVLGVPLLERSLYPLLRAGFTDIVVSVPKAVPAIGEFAASRCARLARAVGSRLSILEETEPLGNIGCAGSLAGRASIVVAVYADNLTTVDLTSVMAHHSRAGANLTLATHLERYRIPYGELITDGRNVIEYREKPEHQVLVCSAICVLGPLALNALTGDRPMGLVDLFDALVQRGHAVSEFRHEAPWIDVNDAERLVAAQRLLSEHAATFDCWLEPPARVIETALVTAADALLLRRIDDPGGGGAVWTLPDVSALQQPELNSHKDELLAEFDDLAIDSGQVARHRVVRRRLRAQPHGVPHGLVWVPRRHVAAPEAASAPLLRAIAADTQRVAGGA